MRRFFKSSGFKVFAVVVVFLFAGSVLSATTHDSSSPFASAVSLVFGPVQRISAKAAREMSELSISFKSALFYKKQIAELEKEVADCRKQIVDYDKAKHKIEFYENFLEIKEENPDYTFVSASIIGRDSTDLFGSFTLNKGSLDGVDINDTIIYNRYLVGVVTAVMPTQCIVETILNPNVSISAYDSRTREAGYVETDAALAKAGCCRLSGIEKTTQIAPDGTVCTSGTGGIYPRDLMIGTVTEIADATENISSYAVLKPFVDFSRLIDVFIITDFSE